jgi:hypothetical protein
MCTTQEVGVINCFMHKLTSRVAASYFSELWNQCSGGIKLFRKLSEQECQLAVCESGDGEY